MKLQTGLKLPLLLCMYQQQKFQCLLGGCYQAVPGQKLGERTDYPLKEGKTIW